jgi:16S rRNA (guanine527-N7)-methyltransferase
VREPSEAWQRHVEDSLALLPAIEQHMPAAATGTISAIDVGTGPGLPGMVLAIARPNWQVRQRCCGSTQPAG